MAPKVSNTTLQAYGITREDVQMIRSIVPSIQTLVPIRYVPKLFVRVGDQSIASTITGTTHDYDRGTSLEVVRGRFLTEADIAKRNNVAVIDSEHAARLFAGQDPIGKAIQFSKEFFTVVGVVETGRPPSIFIPYTTMRSRLGDITTVRKAGTFEMSQYELSEIGVVLLATADRLQTIEIIKNILKKNHSKPDFKVE